MATEHVFPDSYDRPDGFEVTFQAYVDALLARLRDPARWSGRIDVYAEPASTPGEPLQPPACLASLLAPFRLGREELLVVALALAASYARELGDRFAAIAHAPAARGVGRDLMAALEARSLLAIERRYRDVFVDPGTVLRAGLLQLMESAPGCLEPSMALRSYLAGRLTLPQGFAGFARLYSPPQPAPILDAGAQAQLMRLAEQFAAAPPALTCVVGAPGTGRTLAAAYLGAARAQALIEVVTAAVPDGLDVLELEREAHFLGATLLLHFEGDEILPRWRTALGALIARRVPVILAQPAAAPLLEIDDVAAARLELPPPDDALRGRVWSAALPPRLRAGGVSDAQLAYRFRGTPRTIHRLARATLAQLGPVGPADAVTVEAIQETARHTGAARLAKLATRLPRVAAGLDAVVLPAAQRRLLADLVARVRHRHEVLERWGFAQRVDGGGVVALLSGPPGTGKTFSARAVAAELCIPLYRIDLSAVVSKWIGETEKHLGAVFDEAEDCGVALLFDEADALFAKRSEVKGANDRYANLEVGYLLQRIESFSGLCFLTTNLNANLDEAFIRRFALHLRFERPDLEERTLLWQRALPEQAPRAGSVDAAALARRFEDMTGADIRNAALRAAFYAAEAGLPISRTMLEFAATEERSLGGRVVHETERPTQWS